MHIRTSFAVLGIAAVLAAAGAGATLRIVEQAIETSTLSTSESKSVWQYPFNGYQQEWLHLSDVVNGRAELAPPVQTAVDDLLYALHLADGADQLILEER